MTKTEKVKNHLLEHKKITSWEAIQLYRATRLSAIIYNLRDAGMNIVTNMKTAKDEEGRGYPYAEYVLVEE